jgi:O-antigen ligase
LTAKLRVDLSCCREFFGSVTTSRSAPPNRISSFLLFATVAAAPLPFGSTNLTTIAFWCIVLGIALVAASPRALRRGQFVLLGLAAVVAAAYGLVLHEQLAVRPWFATPHPLWLEASAALGTPLEPAVSIARHQPFFALGGPLADMLVLICSFIVCTNRHRARQLLKVMAWSGLAYAVYGIAAFLFDPTRILWREKQAYLDVLTSTFVNRNTAAVYLGSCAIIWLLLLGEDVRRRLPGGQIPLRKMFRQIAFEPSRAIVLGCSMLFVCVAAMFMTGSRAGVGLSLMMLVLAFVMFFYRDLPRRGGMLAVAAVGGALALVLLQVMGAGVSARFQLQGLADEGRLETYRSTLRMIVDHPWFGTGLGTFASSFPAYRSAHASLWGVWDLAHSTPLELAADMGLPLAVIVMAGWCVVLATLIRGIQVRHRDAILPMAALAVAVLALLHSMIDFSLQIPGYALVVFAIVGAGLSQSFRSSVADDNKLNDNNILEDKVAMTL